MKITKRQLKRIIKEEKSRILLEQEDDIVTPAATDHHWPRIDWSTSIGEIVDKWIDMEEKTFDTGDPSMTQDGELSTVEAKQWWAQQVEAASLDLDNELTLRVRKAALSAMKEITEKLVNGEYA